MINQPSSMIKNAAGVIVRAIVVGVVVMAACHTIITDCVVSCGCGSCKLHRLRR
jgi:hypothetical protein